VATAILGRLLHHATVITVAGDSYRMRSHRDALKTARAALSVESEWLAAPGSL
jgi:IstB-like ATP binding protein